MKKIVTLLFVFAIVLTACTGDQGPMGLPGYDGIDGTDGNDGGIDAFSAFQIEIDFNAENDYWHTEDYGFGVSETDVALVYISWETSNGNDVWRLLPQSVPFDDGDLIYNFDFTQTDVSFFLDGTTDFSSLADEWTQGKLFRVVVVAADNIGMDPSNLKEVMQLNNIQSFEMK